MGNKFALLLSLVTFSILLPDANSQCPTLSSGQCFIDCTRSVYRIVCENPTGASLAGDLKVFINTTQLLHLTIWGPDLDRIGGFIFSVIAPLVLELELDNMVKLRYFPEIGQLPNLKRIRIQNSPLLTSMPAELIPSNMEQIYLMKTGISVFTNNFIEKASLPNIKEFHVESSTIDYIQPEYFSLFPSLDVLTIRGCQIRLAEYIGTAFVPVGALNTFVFTGNHFVEKVESERAKNMEAILESVKMAPNGRMDLSNNELPITNRALDLISGFKMLKLLNIRSNRMVDFALAHNRFVQFDRLIALDLSRTNILSLVGLYRGLPKLEELYLSNNSLILLSDVNVFQGLESSSLRYLDLSSNTLVTLPKGLSLASQSLQTLILRGNSLNLDRIRDAENEVVTSESLSGFSTFPHLQRLDISFNKLTTFRGDYLSALTELEFLDISGNNFTQITKEYFANLPSSLKTLNITFCANDRSQTPIFDLDAFSTLPPIRRLLLRSGLLTSSIFEILASVQIGTLWELDLSDNAISNLPMNAKLFDSLSSVKTLLLRYNSLQSIGGGILARLTNLEDLDLSRNQISSVGKSDFAGLLSLKQLVLSSNNLIEVEAGALESLRQLRVLHFKDNIFTDIRKMFGYGGLEIRQLGLQGLRVNCLSSMFFQQMPKLHWIYLNKSIPLYVGRGSFRNIEEDLLREPLRPTPFRKLALSEQSCETVPPNFMLSGDEVYRFVAKDKSNYVQQKLLLSYPRCHSTLERNLASMVTSSICDNPPEFEEGGYMEDEFPSKEVHKNLELEN